MKKFNFFSKIIDYLSKLISARYLGKINSLVLLLTYRCNSHCKTCNIGKLIPDTSSELELEDYLKIFKFFRNTLHTINFTGGEPFLKKDVEEIISSAIMITKNTYTFVATNGLAPVKIYKKIKIILESIPRNKFLNIGVSIDGYGKLHDEIRGVKGNFNKVLHLLKLLSTLKTSFPNLKVNILTVLSKFNVGKLLKFYSFLNKHIDLYDSVLFTISLHISNYYKNSSTIIPKTKSAFIDEIDRFLYSNIKRNWFVDHFLNTVKRDLYSFKDFRKYPCKGGKNYIVIDPYGNVFPCLEMKRKILNIKKHTFLKIKRLNLRNEKCKACHYLICHYFDNLYFSPFKYITSRIFF